MDEFQKWLLIGLFPGLIVAGVLGYWWEVVVDRFRLMIKIVTRIMPHIFRRRRKSEVVDPDVARLNEVRAFIKKDRRHATEVIIMPTPETMPTGWAVTRLVVEDIWDLYVAPTQDAGGFEGPESRALAAILKELYAALPEHSEPRRYKPTIERTEA